MVNITFGGVVCVLLFIVLAFHCRFKLYSLVTMPLFMILFTYYRYFGYYHSLNLHFDVNLLLLFSLFLFLFGYVLGKRLKIKKLGLFYTNLTNNVLTDDKIFISRRNINIYLILTVLYCVFDLWINTKLYGSIENALIRFYGKPMDEDFPTFYKTMQGFIYKALIVFIFVFRFYFNKYNVKYVAFYIAITLLVLIAIPRGSRGAVVFPLALLVAADLFSLTLLKGLTIWRRLKEYLIISGLSVVLILSLTVIRNVNYDDISDLYEAVSSLEMEEAADSYSKIEGDLLLHDVQQCYMEYGHRVPFLSPFYTLETLLVAPIPRVLMPEKKVSFGYVLNEVKNGGTSLDPKVLYYPTAVGWAAGIAGEGWANGGLIGLIFYSILFGIYAGICSKMYYVLIISNTPSSILFALLFYQMSFSFIRGDLLSGFVQGVYPLLIITFLLLFVSKMKCFKI